MMGRHHRHQNYPSEFQQRVFNTLAILGLSQVQVDKINGVFVIRTSEFWKRILYVILRLNSLAKLIFLILLSCGYFQSEFEFFEKMAILLWFLIICLVSISERIYYRKYPFFEILTAWWNVEEAVFKGLGRPTKFLDDLRWIAMWRVWFQGIIALVGILAVIVQYDAAPKYCVFAYSIVPQEDDILKLVFGIHEVLFLCHAWLVYGSVIYLSSVIGPEFTYNIDALQNVMELFILYGYDIRRKQTSRRDQPMHNKRSSRGSGRGSGLALEDDDKNPISSDGGINISRVEYTPSKLLKQYAHVNMVVTQLNNFAAHIFLYMHGCSYVQMVSDVFQMIQILRAPEADFLAVMFFAEDMLVCMYMLFRCFKSMAFLQPSSVAFLNKFRAFLSTARVRETDRVLFTKLKRTLHPTAFKMGPCRVGPWTVGTAMDVLLQYYICVALWQ